MTVQIIEAQADSGAATELVNELEAHLASLYPAESRHGYSAEKLLREGVNFFLILVDDDPAGCGGIQFYGTDYAELKRMYVRPKYRGLGLGKQLVAHLCSYAMDHGLGCVRLETGIHQQEAIGLYEQMGFCRVPPFGQYREDPLSLFLEKQLQFQSAHVNG